MLEGFHKRVVQTLLEVGERHGFALGGGYALRAHGIGDRDSNDIDAYGDKFAREPYERLQEEFIALADARGLTVTVYDDEQDVFRRFIVSDRSTGEVVAVDVGFCSRLMSPVNVDGIGPVISPDDSFAGKLKAMMDRREARDYIDVDEAIRSGRWAPDRVNELMTWARADIQDIEERLAHMRAAHECPPRRFADYGLSRDDQERLFDRLNVAADTLATGALWWPSEVFTGKAADTGDRAKPEPATSGRGKKSRLRRWLEGRKRDSAQPGRRPEKSMRAAIARPRSGVCGAPRRDGGRCQNGMNCPHHRGGRR